MTVTSLGQMSLGASFSAAAAGAAAVDVAVGLGLPEAQARLAGYTTLQANPFVIAPDVAAQLSAAMTSLASIEADLTALNPGMAAAFTAGLAGLVAAQASIDAAYPDIGMRISAVLNQINGFQLQIKTGVVGANVNLALMASMIAELGALIELYNAQLGIAANINASLAIGGLHVFRFDGDISVAGAQLDAAFQAAGIANWDGEVGVGGVGAQVHFMVLVPTAGNSWAALQATMKTT